MTFQNNYNAKVEIMTERLYIRSYEESDFQECIDLYGNEKITKYFDHGMPRSTNEVRELINEKVINCARPYGLFSIFQRSDGSFIGQIDLIPTEDRGVLEIGYIIHEIYHGHGFCTEAAKGVMFNFVNTNKYRVVPCLESNIKKFIATVHPENIASQRVLQKVGMTFEKSQERFGHPRLWYSMNASRILDS